MTEYGRWPTIAVTGVKPLPRRTSTDPCPTNACTIRRSQVTPGPSHDAHSACKKAIRHISAPKTLTTHGLAGSKNRAELHYPARGLVTRPSFRSATIATTKGDSNSLFHHIATSTVAWSVQDHTPESTALSSANYDAQAPPGPRPPAASPTRLTTKLHLLDALLTTHLPPQQSSTTGGWGIIGTPAINLS